MGKKVFSRWAALLFCCLLSGCETLRYYHQSISGHFEIMRERRPIETLLASSQLDDKKRQSLLAVQRIREFAGRHLDLPSAHQYDSYADIGRPYVAWAVSAAGELSLRPKQWCYPLVGCLDYRGFFKKADADAYADRLAQEGWDVYVAPVEAYSTLGWFRDPVLDSFLRRSEPDMAELIFHELAHQRLFIKGDTVFNESFATAVAELGLEQYAKEKSLGLSAWYLAHDRHGAFVALILHYREQLQAVYEDADMSASAKRTQKAAIFADLQRDYRLLRASWGGYTGYDPWMAQVNNAHLVSVADYHELQNALEQLFVSVDQSWERFYKACEGLRHRSRQERHLWLKSVESAKVEL